MGKFKEKLKGRRQSKNVIDLTDPVASEIGKDRVKREALENQGYKGEFSVHLKDKTPIAKQKADEFTDFMNRVNNTDKKMVKRAKKLMQIQETLKPKKLTDAIFPKTKK